MPSRFHLVAVALLSLVLPLCAHAADGTTPSADEDTAAPELSTEAVPLTIGGADLLATLFGDSAPIAQSCEYHCPFCPDFPDAPPAICDGGCCVYDYPCESTCDFDSDCGEMASCWSGCCYYWNH
jgi:hypothetical protein